jgi:antibiotic biosynthesis monooxygenase (ABM) superfamily enzyme
MKDEFINSQDSHKPITVLVSRLCSLILSAILVLLMTYVVMPRMTQLFTRWLYPSTAKS